MKGVAVRWLAGIALAAGVLALVRTGTRSGGVDEVEAVSASNEEPLRALQGLVQGAEPTEARRSSGGDRCGGGVRLVFRDRNGDPVQGVRAALFPPRATRERTEPRRVVESDDHGVMEWTDLGACRSNAWLCKNTPSHRYIRSREPGGTSEQVASNDVDAPYSDSLLEPGADYRWGVVDAAGWLVEVVPANEGRRVRPRSDGGFLVSEPTPGHLSGAFAVGDTVSCFEVPCTTGGTITGRIVGAPRGQTTVRLFGIELHTNGTSLLRENALSGEAVAEEDGGFRFEGVAAGNKLVRAVVNDRNTDYYFASRAFLHAPGAVTDLGDIGVRAGSLVECSIGFVDEEGAPLAVEDLFSVQLPSVYLEVFAGHGRVADAEATLAEMLEVTIGPTIRLHGVPGDLLRAAVTDAYDDWPADPEGVSIWPPERVEVPLPNDAPVVLSYVVRATFVRRLRVLAPTEGERFRAAVLILSDDHQEIADFRINLTPHAGGTEADFTQAFPPGAYHVLVHSCPLGAPADRPNLFALGRIDVDGESGEEIALTMQPGATVLGAADAELSRFTLALALEGWGSSERGPHPWAAHVDPDGRFRIDGLIPHRSYTFFGGTTFEVGGPGTTTYVTVEEAGDR